MTECGTSSRRSVIPRRPRRRSAGANRSAKSSLLSSPNSSELCARFRSSMARDASAALTWFSPSWFSSASSARFASRLVALAKCGVRLTSTRVRYRASRTRPSRSRGAWVMERILDARGDWQTAIADALSAAAHPIPMDERLLPRTRDGQTIRRTVDRATLPPARPAATLLAIYPDDDGRLLIPVTVRREELRAHAGEVSLPGGRVDEADASHEAAALREAWEEIGLQPGSVRILGTLDEVWIPVTNYEL